MDIDVHFASSVNGFGAAELSKNAPVSYLPYKPLLVQSNDLLRSPFKFCSNWIRNYFGTKKNEAWLKVYVIENSIDIIFLNGYQSIPRVKVRGKLIPVISVIHTAPGIDHSWFHFKYRYIGHLLNSLTEVVVVGKNIKDQLQPYTRKEIIHLPSATQDFLFYGGKRSLLRGQLGIEKDAICIGTIGRFNRNKGYLEIVKSFEKLASLYSQLHCVLAGEPVNNEDIQYYKEVISYVSRSEYKSRIHLTGQMKNFDFYAVIDIFYLFTINMVEAFGLVVIEAMSAGKPVIAPNVGGPKEILEHGVTGLLAQSGNVDEYTSYARDLIEDSELSSNLALRSREKYLSTYNLPNWGRNWVSILDNLMMARIDK